jgi:HlyD family secretion protein
MNRFLSMLLAVCFFALQSCKPDYNTTKPIRRDITQVIYASGKIYPKQRRLLASKTGGYVQQIYVKAGDSIQAGMPILAIRSEITDLGVQTAENNLKLANANANNSSASLLAIQEDIKMAQTKYSLDSANAIRFQNLWQQNATSKILYEQTKTQAEISFQQLQKARLALQGLSQKTNTDYQNAKNVYATQKAVKGDFVLYADMAMRVYDIRIKVGELVSPAVPIIEVGQNSDFEVELAIDESDLGLVKVGQEVIFELNSMKNTFLKGKLTEVYPTINPLNKTGKVIASLDTKANINLFSGMSIEANIVIAERKQVLVLPRNFVFDNEYVVSKENKKIKIQKGLEDIEYIEVLQGLNDQTEVIDKPLKE